MKRTTCLTRVKIPDPKFSAPKNLIKPYVIRCISPYLLQNNSLAGIVHHKLTACVPGEAFFFSKFKAAVCVQTISRTRRINKLSGVKGRQVCSKGVITNLLPFNS